MSTSPVASVSAASTSAPVAPATASTANILDGDYAITVTKDFKIKWTSTGNCKLAVVKLISLATKLATDPEVVESLAQQGIQGMAGLTTDPGITLADNDMYTARVHVVLTEDLNLAIAGSSAGEVDLGAIFAKVAPLFKELVEARMATM